MKNKLLLIIALFCAITACNKNKTPDPILSAEISLSVTLSSSGVNYQSQINNIDAAAIKQVGFIWSRQPEPKFGAPGVLSYVNQTISLQYNYNVTAGLIKDSVYYVRSFYIDNNNNYYYSGAKSFTSGGTPQLSLRLDKTYTWGDEAEITLDPLTVTNVNDIDIFINQNAKIHPTRIAAGKVYFKIANDLQDQYNVLAAAVYGQQSNKNSLSLYTPQITPGGSTSLSSGETMVIGGNYFHPEQIRNQVSIGSAKLDVVSSSTTQLTVKANQVSISQTGKLTIQTGTTIKTISEADYKLYKFLKPKKDFPGVARMEGVALNINNIIYFGLGRNKDTGRGLNDWWKYDAVSDSWTRLADYPADVVLVAAFTIGNKAYVGMGYFDDYPSGAFYAYDPAKNTWDAIAPFQGKFTRQPVAFGSSKYGYIVGGEQSNPGQLVRVNDAWRYDPITNSWTQIGSFPGTARSEACGFQINNTGYVLGGSIQSINTYDHDVWAFDFNTEKWKQVASIPQDLGTIGGFTFTLQGKGYLGGGNISDSQGPSSLIYEYDPTQNTWTKKEFIMDEIKFGAAAASLTNTAYIICGAMYSGGSKSFFQFTP